MQAHQLSWLHIYVIYIWNKKRTPPLGQTKSVTCQQFTSDGNLNSIPCSTYNVVSGGVKTSCACFHPLQPIHNGWHRKSLRFLCSVYLQEREQGSKGPSGGGAEGRREQISSSFAVVAAYTNFSKSNVSSVGPVFFQPQ